MKLSSILKGVDPLIYWSNMLRFHCFFYNLRSETPMRIVHDFQTALGQIPIEDIEIDPRSRDDIPAVLKGIQHIYCDLKLRQQHLRPARAAPSATDRRGRTTPARSRRPGSTPRWAVPACSCGASSCWPCSSRASTATSTAWRSWPTSTLTCDACWACRTRSASADSASARWCATWGC